jgi:hypothetical protein
MNSKPILKVFCRGRGLFSCRMKARDFPIPYAVVLTTMISENLNGPPVLFVFNFPSFFHRDTLDYTNFPHPWEETFSKGFQKFSHGFLKEGVKGLTIYERVARGPEATRQSQTLQKFLHRLR